jgi:starch-binding outer membrane protein, SusD/RagB family
MKLIQGKLAALSLAGAGFMIMAVACDTQRLLDVSAPNNVPVAILDDPLNATLMVNSAITDFECAFASAVLVEGIISDELGDAQLGAAGWPYDRRDANTQTNGIYGANGCNSAQNPGIYTPLATARWDADHALKNLTGWTDAQVANRQLLLAQSNLYAGFSYAMMGMSMCQAAFDLGPSVDQKGMFTLAEQRFTAAITAGQAAANTDIVNAAYGGRARVRLYLANATGAATDAALVPAGFAFNATFDGSNSRRFNRVFSATSQFGDYTVEVQSQNLKTERGEVDPRSQSTFVTTRPADAKTPIYVPAKYAAGNAVPIPMASYEEARLIMAEVQGGAGAVTIINALRSTVGLQPYTGATDAASIKSLVIDERRRVLFAQGTRNYDIQRFTIPFNPTVGTPFPIKGGTYGNTVCLPLPDVERFNNPNVGS